MATSTTVNSFPVPLASNTGWRSPDGGTSVLGDFFISSHGDVSYKTYPVGTDATYGADVLANAINLTSLSDYSAQAAAAIAAMP